MTRRFEYVAGTSSKFWEVSVAGCNTTVRYGRIGASGQSLTKTFSTPVAARQHADKLIDEKTKKGYRETTGSAA